MYGQLAKQTTVKGRDKRQRERYIERKGHTIKAMFNYKMGVSGMMVVSSCLGKNGG